MKTARQDALRALRDKQRLFEDGRARRSSSSASTASTSTPSRSSWCSCRATASSTLHLTGTDYFERLERSASWTKYARAVGADLVSETPEVYRGEYLAAQVLLDAEEGEGERHARGAAPGGARAGRRCWRRVRAVSADRLDEGYERGIHDADAAPILEKLLALHAGAGLLRFAPTPRALGVALLAPLDGEAEESCSMRRARSLRRLRAAFGERAELRRARRRARARAHRAPFARSAQRLPHGARGGARSRGRYLVEELGAGRPRFIASGEAVALRDAFLALARRTGNRSRLRGRLARRSSSTSPERLRVALAWVEAFVAQPRAATARRPSCARPR